MSIINDALKKSQENVDKKSENQDVTDLYDKLHPSLEENKPPHTVQITSKTGSNPFQTLFAFVFLLSSLVGIFFAFLHFVDNDTTRSLKKQLVTLKKIKITTPSLPKPLSQTKAAVLPSAPLVNQPIAIQAPTPTPKAQESDLILNGTIQNGKSTAALINNEVYEVGDIIEGKKITNITLNKVELINDQGAITTISVK